MGEMICEYCLETTALQTAAILCMDSSLFRSFVFTVFYLEMLGTIYASKTYFHFKLSQKKVSLLNSTSLSNPFMHLLYKHMFYQVK